MLYFWPFTHAILSFLVVCPKFVVPFNTLARRPCRSCCDFCADVLQICQVCAGSFFFHLIHTSHFCGCSQKGCQASSNASEAGWSNAEKSCIGTGCHFHYGSASASWRVVWLVPCAQGHRRSPQSPLHSRNRMQGDDCDCELIILALCWLLTALCFLWIIATTFVQWGATGNSGAT